MSYKGIDVSEHNGNIDWSKVKSNIDFAIIRAGYGQNNIDKTAIQNINGCKNNNIPFGLYWFSYALSEEMAKKEADYVCDIADKYRPNYPICYDWEYDSDNYAKKKNINITNETRKKFARAFLNRVEERGYYAMIYTNIDYLGKGFNELLSRYDVWLAQWGVNSPSKSCGIWQSSSSGKVSGIATNVDIDISYKDYTIYSKNTPTNPDTNMNNILSEKDKQEILSHLANNFWNEYIKIAKDIIAGKYGNGNTRRVKLESLGHDYNVAQTIVDYMLK